MKDTDKNCHTSMRAGWTVIELIFVLVIIGILAAIAITKLSTTRDDAKLSADVANMNVCLQDMKNIYTARRTTLTDINASSCNRVVCYIIDINNTTMDVRTSPAAALYCNDIEQVGGHMANRYNLAAPSVKR